MIRFSHLLTLLLILPFVVVAQMPLNESRYADSLQRVAANKQLGDSSRAHANYLLTGFFGGHDAKKAKLHFEEANRLAKPYPYLVAGAPFYEAYLFEDGSSQSMELYKKADRQLSRFKDKGTYMWRAKIWLNYASMLQFHDKKAEMVSTIIGKAIPLAKKGGNNILLSFMYADLATILSNIGQLKEALTYYTLAIRGLEQSNHHSSRFASVYVGLTYTLCQLSNYKEAGIMLDKARKQLAPYPKSSAYPDFYATESMYYNKIGSHQLAIQSAEKGLVLARELGLDYMIQGLTVEKLVALRQMKRYKEAKQVFAVLQQDKTFQSLSEGRSDIYKMMSEVYAEEKQMDLAYHWLQKYSELSDSLSSSNMKKEIGEMEIRFRTEENLHKITVLKSQKAKAEYEAGYNRLVVWLLASAVVFILILSVLLMLNYKKSRRLVLQESVNLQQQLRELAQQKQLQVSSALIEGEERERKRMARDLHDGLGGMLAGIKLHLSAMLQYPDRPVSSIGGLKVVEQLDQSLNELRRIAKNMMPETLIKFGLEKAIADLCLSFTNDKLQVDFQSFGIDENLPEKTQIMIYRIIQEILANAVRHASASSIMLQCSQNGDVFLITAEDDGRGFEFDAQVAAAGMGMSNIKNRVEYLNGKLELNSIINEGTVINIELDVCSTS
ncbi:sensor histidine kinase [Pedobacter sp. MC2016-15]|uniref:tetratricopeptide repeat-containing sensor histidine kinase n=1 Tax=Pedobacter sp. MC2016-15 TaxID=2994473 RepID=UPI002246D3C4|nr:sensor histidine kinase [Pedobacter sp. MC2016-15]MCX2481062.1 sensor histidine kinase [Pedobacter sp. MC2016-15]